MPSSVKLPGNPEWFQFTPLDSKKTDTEQIDSGKTKRSINLGKKMESEGASLLPSRLTLTELLQYKDCMLAKHISKTNTFFHGKVGFHEMVMRKVFAVMGESSKSIEYLHTAQNLPRENKPARLILLPTVKSKETLNDFVAQSLRHKSQSAVWLVANPSSVHKHLLLCFHNFFIASNNPDELKHLQNVFSLPKLTADLLLSNEREAVFITDFEPVVNSAYLPIAIVRLESFE
jgi:hypothetical protein